MMNCKVCQNELPELLLGGSAPAAQLQEHLAACAACRQEYDSLLDTIHLLDEWKAPELSPYFDQRLAAHLREEIAAPRLGLVARLRDRILFGSRMQLRPAMAGVMALVLLVGGGTIADVLHTGGHSAPVTSTQPSAAVNDLQILDNNAQAIQQMDQLFNDDSDASSSSDSSI